MGNTPEARLIAFAVTAEYEEEELAGSVVYGTEGKSLDVADALDEREDGVIVVDADSPKVLALDGFEALKRVSVPDDAQEEADAALAAEAAKGAKASDAAAAKAAELGVDLSTVEGSGARGNITVDDVEKAAAVAAEAGDGEAVGDEGGGS